MNEPKHVLHPFPPLYDENSKVLILGSFPSVKSREQMFFYGHPQNRFWKKWHSAPSVKRVTTSVILPTFSHRCILQITVKITVFTAVLTAITIFTENSFPWKKLSMK